MNPLKAILFLTATIALVISAGCSSSRTTTIWENQHSLRATYSKVMITAVVDRADTTLRILLENNFRRGIQETGYPAVSSYEEFSGGGLRGLDQEDTYLALCNRGIDAVITLAVIDRPGNKIEPHLSFTNPVQYYYDRMWSYKSRPENYTANFYDSSKSFSWEMILYDLATLQPRAIIHSGIYRKGIPESIRKKFWNEMLKKLLKDRVLQKRQPVTDTRRPGLKAF